MGLFDLETEETNINDNNGKMSIRKNSYKKIARIENRDEYFSDEMNPVKMPNPSEVVCIKTNGLSDAGSIFRYILNTEKVDELYLSTWVISRENIAELVKAIEDGKINKLCFVVSVRLQQLKKSVYAYLVEEFEKHQDKIFYKVCNSHAKGFSVKTEKNYYTVIGSGNWTENPRIENYIIHNDLGIFNFNKDWIEDLTHAKNRKTRV